MRKLFMSIIGISAILTLALGVAFAWSASTAPYAATAQAGALSVALFNVNATANELYPTNTPIDVLTGGITNNTPANPGIPVYVKDGSVSSTNTCLSAGSLTPNNQAWVAPGQSGDLWTVALTMPAGAPDSCQGTAVAYQVVVNVNTQ